MVPQTKEETFIQLQDIALADLATRSPEKRDIWPLVWGQDGGKDERSRLEASLAFAHSLPHPILRMLVAELRREDSIAVNGVANYGFPGRPGAAELLALLFPPLGHLFSPSAEQVQADLIDLLVLGARSCGMSGLFTVLDITACFGAVQLHYLTRLHPPRGPHPRNPRERNVQD